MCTNHKIQIGSHLNNFYVVNIVAKLPSCSIVVHCTLVKQMFKCFIGIKHLAIVMKDMGCAIFSPFVMIQILLLTLKIKILYFIHNNTLLHGKVINKEDFQVQILSPSILLFILTRKRLYGYNFFSSIRFFQFDPKVIDIDSHCSIHLVLNFKNIIDAQNIVTFNFISYMTFKLKVAFK